MDEGGFVIDYRTPYGTSLAETNRQLLQAEEILRATPEVESYSRRTGAQLGFAITEPNTGDFLVKLKKAKPWLIHPNQPPLAEGEFLQTPAQVDKIESYLNAAVRAAVARLRGETEADNIIEN